MTLKREIKDAYLEGGNSIYVNTHSNAVFVDDNETETLTQRLDNVKSSIEKHTSQLNEIVPNTTMWYLQNINYIRINAVINSQGFYSIDEETSCRYRVKKIDGSEVWTIINYKDYSFKISNNGDLAANKELTTEDSKLCYISNKNEYNINCFGAIPNSNYYNSVDFKFYEDNLFSLESFDNSLIIQSVVNRMINGQGGILNLQQGRYKISNTIYINPPKTCTINIRGIIPIKAGNETMYNDQSKVIYGSRILCDTDIVFSVNRDKSGVQVDGSKSAQFEGFISENIAFDGVKTGDESSGITGTQPTFKDSIAYYILGTRFSIKNCGCYGLSSFIYQPQNDSADHKNYSDFINIENIYSRYVKNSLITLSRCDVSNIKGIYCENTKMGASSIIRIFNAQQVNISCVSASMHSPQSIAPNSESAMIQLLLVNGANISNIYCETNYIFESMIYTYNSYSVNIENLSDQGLTEDHGTHTILKLRNSNVYCKGVHSRAKRSSGRGDFNITNENLGKSKLILEDCDIRDFKKDTMFQDLKVRLPYINGAENLSTLKLKDLKLIKVITNADKTISIKSFSGEDLTNIFGTPTWDGTGIVFQDKISINSITFKNYLFYIPLYPIPNTATKKNSMSHTVGEANRGNGFIKYCFYDNAGDRITTQDDMMNFNLICE